MAAKKPNKVWDGRGDALADARLTMAAGRMADDLRLKETHLRIMAHVGRQNGARGWLRVSQSELAARWDVHRGTINRCFRELVEWGYLSQRTQEEAGESFCLYKVTLDADDDTAASPVKHGGGVSHQDDTPPGGECRTRTTPVSHQDDTRVRPHVTPPTPAVLSTRANYRLSPTNADTPPQPPTRGRAARRGSREREIDELILSILEPEGVPHDARIPATRRLLEPIVRKLKIDAPDPAFALGAIAEAAAGEPGEVLERAREIIFAERNATVKPSDIEHALAQARKEHEHGDLLARGPLIFKTQVEAWEQARAALAAINPGEAEILFAREFVRKDRLKKLGVDVERLTLGRAA